MKRNKLIRIMALPLPLGMMTAQDYQKPKETKKDEYIIVNQSDEDRVSDLMYKFSYQPKQQ